MSELEAKQAISELVTSWTYFRDQEAWDKLEASFVPEGRISISWFDGKHEDFVAASKQMAARGGSLLKHQVGPAVIHLNRDKALSEVNVVIMVRVKTPFGQIDTASYARFYDRLVKVDSNWQFLDRVGVYEKDRVDPVDFALLPDAFFDGLAQYPEPIKFLAKSLVGAGLTISNSVVLDRSSAWQALRKSNEDWLAAERFN